MIFWKPTLFSISVWSHCSINSFQLGKSGASSSWGKRLLTRLVDFTLTIDSVSFKHTHLRASLRTALKFAHKWAKQRVNGSIGSPAHTNRHSSRRLNAWLRKPADIAPTPTINCEILIRIPIFRSHIEQSNVVNRVFYWWYHHEWEFIVEQNRWYLLFHYNACRNCWRRLKPAYLLMLVHKSLM